MWSSHPMYLLDLLSKSIGVLERQIYLEIKLQKSLGKFWLIQFDSIQCDVYYDFIFSFLSALYSTQVLAITMVFGFSLLIGSSIRQQIWEKESQNAMVNIFFLSIFDSLIHFSHYAIQILEVMGFYTSVNWSIWLIMTLVMLIVLSGLVTMILFLSSLIQYSNPFLVFLLLLCSSFTLLSFW